MSNFVSNYRRASLPALALAAACAHGSGTEPHEMSAAQHEAAARQEQAVSEEHAAQHDPNASVGRTTCGVRRRVCWTEYVNPTAPHLKTAEEHRQLAAQHRAASQALQAAEASACAGLDEEDRDASPFAHAADIQSVTPLEQRSASYADTTGADAGATVVFRATPGLTTEWLQRIVNCHLARNAAAGHDMPEMPYCPLVPPGVDAKVRSVGDGFAVDVTSKDPATAAEILRRAQQLTATHEASR